MRKYLQSLKNSMEDMKLELLFAKAVKTSFKLVVVCPIDPFLPMDSSL